MTSKADRAARLRAAFLEYRRTREPEPLAEVFDLTAQELLLVAHHLAGRGVAPEDLVQATFLEAIRMADSFDAERPVAPWLCGILANLARRQKREQARVWEAWRFDAPAEADPAELAYVREFASAVQEALKEFPAPQREVLTLRLIHGLSATQIAQALDRPVGSVKSWIHRGVDRLKVMLPATIAAGLSAISSADPLLEQVRANVLRHAAELALPASSSGTADSARHAASSPPAPSWSVGPRAYAVFAALAVGAIVLVFATRPSPASEAPASTLSSSASAGADVASASASLAGRRNSIAAPRELEAASAGALELRARFASDGEPAVLTVRIEARHGNDPAFRARVLRTDERGHARVEGLEPGAYVVTTDHTPPLAVELGPEGTVVEITAPAGRRVHGRVVDSAGNLVADAPIWMSAYDSLNEGEIVATTRADGGFDLRDAALERVFAVLAPGYAPSALFAVADIDARAADEGLEVRLDELRSDVRGRVVDEAGAPLAGARVLVGDPLDPIWRREIGAHALHAPLTVVTDADGSFRATWLAPPFSGRVRARAAGYAFAEASLDGAEMLLRLERGAVWSASAPESCAGGGDVTLRAESALAPRFAPRWLHPTCVLASAGAFEVTGVQPGVSRVVSIDGAGRMRSRAETARGGGVVDWPIACAAGQPLRGTLRAWNGVAFAGARVRAVGRDGAAWQTLTDANGDFAFEHALEGEHTVSAYVTDDPVAALLLRRVGVEPSGAPLELVVAPEFTPSAYLVASARGVDGAPFGELSAISARDASTAPSEVLPDGRVRFGPLAPGEYAIAAYGELGPLLHHGPVRVEAGRELDCGELLAEPVGQLALRLAGVGEGELAKLDASLHSQDGAFGLTFFKLAQGRGTCLPTVAGPQQLLVRVPGRGLYAASVELREGVTTTLELPAPTGSSVALLVDDAVFEPALRMRLRFARADGRVAANIVDLVRRPAGETARRTSWILEPGAWRVELESECGLRGVSDFSVPQQARELEVRVELR
jgi:RNA polymerase sigma-70 factor (ECF subfamily)